MLNAIKEIYKWQVDAGNASKPYDDFLESSFQVEEALEGFSELHSLWHTLNVNNEATEDFKTPKNISRDIVKIAKDGCLHKDSDSSEESLSDVDRLDKACDAIVYAIGSMAKLGLDHHAITKALNIVNNANKQKLNAKRDSAGKLGKPDDFVGPEAELLALIDSIKK